MDGVRNRRYDGATVGWHGPEPVRLDTLFTAVLTCTLINIPVPHCSGLRFPGSCGPGTRVWTTPAQGEAASVHQPGERVNTLGCR